MCGWPTFWSQFVSEGHPLEMTEDWIKENMDKMGLEFQYFDDKGAGGREVGWGVVVEDPDKGISSARSPGDGKPAKGIHPYLDLHLETCKFLKDPMFHNGQLFRHLIYSKEDFPCEREDVCDVYGVMNPCHWAVSWSAQLGT